MDNVDLLITGGEVITHTGRRHATVAIRQGKVVALTGPHAALRKRKE